VFYFNDKLYNELPFRIVLPNGKTHTSLHKLSEEELISLGIYSVDIIKPEITKFQYYGEPNIIIENNRAIATYPIIEYSIEEQEHMFNELKNQKYNEIATARYNAEISGIDVNNVTVKTDRESQALITGAALQAMVDSEYSCKWKTEQGFVELTAEEILGIAVMVRQHVQECFDKEAELTVLIEEAQTIEDLNEIVWNENIEED